MASAGAGVTDPTKVKAETAARTAMEMWRCINESPSVTVDQPRSGVGVPFGEPGRRRGMVFQFRDQFVVVFDGSVQGDQRTIARRAQVPTGRREAPPPTSARVEMTGSAYCATTRKGDRWITLR